MNVVITVVVPVYNTEDYVAECVQSIRNQTFTDFEVILVNDGTQDNSIEVALTSIDNDKRFRVIHQQNKGLGVARNTGINHAQGKYICFVDSDDFIDKNYLKYMYNELQTTQASICRCNIVYYTSKTETQHSSFNFTTTDSISTIRNILLGLEVITCCNSLYRIQLFQTLRFPIGLYEDTLMSMAIALENTTVPTRTINQALYYYRQKRVGSITYQIGLNSIQDLVKNVIFQPKQLLLNNNLYSKLEDEYRFYAMQTFIYLTLKILESSENFYTTYSYLKRQVREHGLKDDLNLIKFFISGRKIHQLKLMSYLKKPLVIGLANFGMAKILRLLLRIQFRKTTYRKPDD